MDREADMHVLSSALTDAACKKNFVPLTNSIIKTFQTNFSTHSHPLAPYFLPEFAHSVLRLRPDMMGALLAFCLHCVRQPIQTGQQFRFHPILKQQHIHSSSHTLQHFAPGYMQGLKCQTHRHPICVCFNELLSNISGSDIPLCNG